MNFTLTHYWCKGLWAPAWNSSLIYENKNIQWLRLSDKMKEEHEGAAWGQTTENLALIPARKGSDYLLSHQPPLFLVLWLLLTFIFLRLILQWWGHVPPQTESNPMPVQWMFWFWVDLSLCVSVWTSGGSVKLSRTELLIWGTNQVTWPELTRLWLKAVLESDRIITASKSLRLCSFFSHIYRDKKVNIWETFK